MGDVQRWTVGDVVITSVVEAQTDHIPPELFFPAGTTAEVAKHDWVVPDFADEVGNIGMRIQALVVEAARRRHIVHRPVQCAETEWAEIGDADADEARATRRRMLDEAATSGALFIGTRSPTRPSDRVVVDGDARRFVPA